MRSLARVDTELPVPSDPSLVPAALRGGVRGFLAAGAVAGAVILSTGLVPWAASTLRPLLGWSGAQAAALLIPLVTLLGAARTAGSVEAASAKRRSGGSPEKARAALAGAGLGATVGAATVVALAAFEAWRWFEPLVALSIPAALGVGTFGRRAFAALEDHSARDRRAPEAPPQAYPAMAAAGLAPITFVMLFSGVLKVLDWAGLSTLRALAWTMDGMAGLAAQGLFYSAMTAAMLGSAWVTGRLIQRVLPEARPATLLLSAGTAAMFPLLILTAEALRFGPGGGRLALAVAAVVSVAGTGAVAALRAAAKPAALADRTAGCPLLADPDA